MAYERIEPASITDNVFHLIGSDWMLVTAARDTDGLVGGKDWNTMTASWGGLGVLWAKPAAFVFIRPQRHTFGFIEEADRLTLSFFDESYRDALRFCGTKSGRDYDKAAACSLTPVTDRNEVGRALWFEEARLVLVTRKLYGSFLREDGFTAAPGSTYYPAGDYHKMYVCEIESVLRRV